MEFDLVGFRFHPTGEELINHYLKNKILCKSWLLEDAIVAGAISEINICSCDPEILPSISKIGSKDLVWYFFSPREYTTSKKTAAKRTTPSGFWKSTGKDRIIKDKRGNGVEIGIKKTLVYHLGRVPNGVWTPWVMHEYHITSLPLPLRTYVICQVMYKGEDGDVSFGNSSSEPSHSLVSDPNYASVIHTAPEVQHPVQGNLDGLSLSDLQIPLNEHTPDDGFNPNTFLGEINSHNNPSLQPQSPGGSEYWSRLMSFNGGDYDGVFSNQELMMYMNHSNHGPKRPVSGIIVDGSESDSDAETISVMSYQGTSSPDGSSNKHFPSSSSTDSCKDLQTFADPSTNRKNRKSQLTRRTRPSTQEMKKGKSKAVDASMDKELLSMVKKEKRGWFITEETMERNRKDPPYIYLMNMVIGFILLLALISDIISVFVSGKT